MSVATMLQPASRVSRASTSSSSSYMPVSRQNTMSSNDGRSVRQSKRYSAAVYLSMSANNRDLEIEDDLARGMRCVETLIRCTYLLLHSSESTTRSQIEDIEPIEEEFRA